MKTYYSLILLGCMSIVILIPACTRSSAIKQAKPILIEDFEVGNETSLYTALESHPKLEIVDGQGVNNSKGLKATYVGYHRGSERIVVESPIGERGTAYTLCYDIRFDDDFQFVRGGKIMGLGPDAKITGGHSMTPGGWSARSNFASEGGVHTYIYSQNKSGKWGESVHSEAPVFKKGQYHRVTLRVRLNEPEDTNGAATIFVDGRLYVEHTGIQFRRVQGDSTLISSILFETFHGGNTERYAPRKENGDYATVNAYFDNIAVYRGAYLCMPE